MASDSPTGFQEDRVIANGFDGQPPPRRVWAAVAALCAAFLVLAALGDEARTALRFDRAALAQGQWWRLLSAHLVHLGWAHALLNVIGVVLCGLLAPAVFGRGLGARLVLLGLGVGLALWLASPGVPDYAGFSGVLYGLFAWGLLPQLRAGDRIAGWVLAGIAGWMLWQWIQGPAVSEELLIGGHIVGIAHVYGFCGGIVGWGACALAARRRRGR
ncbi:rhombosortase [Castellaniella sp. S9]|uniref:rhombosortase n=1 Tax=Castellaniella sp. S9 TaxID=2993652 RepID=UPI0022B4336E|nr:rhombosortase [Castellaniella sp. S9]